MKILLWITDAHLDHLADHVKDARFGKLAKSRADMLFLGGDTAKARVFSRMIGRIGEVFIGQVALVAGNHDYYHSSISDFRKTGRASEVWFGCFRAPLPNEANPACRERLSLWERWLG